MAAILKHLRTFEFETIMANGGYSKSFKEHLSFILFVLELLMDVNVLTSGKM